MQVHAPLVSTNERELRVVAVHVSEGQQVTQDQPLLEVETTKAALELVAERAGYVVGLLVQVGDVIPVGRLLLSIEDSPRAAPAPEEAPDASLRLTDRARELLQESGLDPALLPTDRIVTASMVEAVLAEQAPPVPPPESLPTTGPILLYGGGRHATMVIELLRGHPTLELIGIVDDTLQPGESVLDAPVLGDRSLLPELRERTLLFANGLGSLPNLTARLEIARLLTQQGFLLPPLVHARAIVESSATVACGAQVHAGAHLGPRARVGPGAIVNTGAIVSHDCRIGENATVSPGAVLAGEVQLAPRCVVGMGVLLNVGVTVGEEARIGNGAIVQSDVPPRTFVRSGSHWSGDADVR